MMTNSIQGTASVPTTWEDFSDYLWRDIIAITGQSSPRTVDAIACTCKRFRDLVRAHTFDASAMTIEEFESLPVNKGALKVTLPREIGTRFNAQPTNDRKMEILQVWAQVLSAQFPSYVRVVMPGTDVNATDDGWTPLCRALSFDHTTAVIELLIKAGADVNKSKRHGDTPIHLATTLGRITQMKMLIEAGAEVNKTASGWTPLHVAAMWGEVAIVKLLIEAGADADKKDTQGRTALDIAREANPGNRAWALTALLERAIAEQEDKRARGHEVPEAVQCAVM